MATVTIKRGDPGYDKLLKAYEADPGKGWIVLPNGGMYKVLHPSDDEVVFSLKDNMGMYNSLSGSSSGS